MSYFLCFVLEKEGPVFIKIHYRGKDFKNEEQYSLINVFKLNVNLHRMHLRPYNIYDK